MQKTTYTTTTNHRLDDQTASRTKHQKSERRATENRT